MRDAAKLGVCCANDKRHGLPLGAWAEKVIVAGRGWKGREEHYVPKLPSMWACLSVSVWLLERAREEKRSSRGRGILCVPVGPCKSERLNAVVYAKKDVKTGSPVGVMMRCS